MKFLFQLTHEKLGKEHVIVTFLSFKFINEFTFEDFVNSWNENDKFIRSFDSLNNRSSHGILC